VKLGDAHTPSLSRTTNACVASACAAITGIAPETWVHEFRKVHPKACTARRGTGPREYLPALMNRGYTVSRVQPWQNIGYTVPLHVALTILNRDHPGAHLLLVIKERRGTHMIAANGFMVVDNTSIGPRWWADWVECWQNCRQYLRSDWRTAKLSKPRPARVLHAYVVKKELKFLN